VNSVSGACMIRRLRGAVALVLAGALLGIAACERALAPRASRRLFEIRQIAPDGYGTFRGRVLGAAAVGTGQCGRTGQPLAGVRVELGVWHGSPMFYRDTLTRLPPATEGEPRFERVADTVTDQEGRFVFANLPRRAPFALRAMPALESGWRIGYGVSLFGLGNVDLEDFPTLCVGRR
jgi:hypothetical protein